MELISIVVPCYNEQETLPFFYDEFVKLAESMKEQVEFEAVFVNDGSRDLTLEKLRELAAKDERVKYISFSRNFGKEAGMLAGLKKAKGDYICTMDADLQDPPELLKEMYEGIKVEGYDCIGTRRVSRDGEPFFRSIFANLFYWGINKISDTKIVNGARDFRLMTRQMIDSILAIDEYNRFSKGIFSFVGYKTKWLEYKNVERVAGETSWSFWNLFKYSIEGVLAFSTGPLYIAAILGLILTIMAFIFALVIVIKTLAYGEPVAGYPSLVCVISLLGGVQLFTTGILGQYLGKLYLEAKKRPHYFIKEEV